MLHNVMKRMASAAAGLVLSMSMMLSLAMPAAAKSADGKTVIVIDPGHGGTDIGAQYDPYVEKAMTMYTSLLIEQELLQYDNVAVYLTRRDDSDVTLAQRVDYAHSVNADFMLSVHFNANAGVHNRTGSMMLITAFGNLYAREASFGLLNLQQLEAAGLNNRGFYTRLGSTGQDYYGIIRRSASYGLPAVITEHCYIDNETDRAFLARSDSYQRLAHADATALAQYLHLKSTALGIDYSNYPLPQVAAPADSTTPVMIIPQDSDKYY